jgi:hypothetical protein
MRSRRLWGGRARPGLRCYGPGRWSRRMRGRRGSDRRWPGWYWGSHGPRRWRNWRAGPRSRRGGARRRWSHHGPRDRCRHVGNRSRWWRWRHGLRCYSGWRRRHGRLLHCHGRCLRKGRPAVAAELALGRQCLAAVGANDLWDWLGSCLLSTASSPSRLHGITTASAHCRGPGIGCPASRTPNVADGSLFGIFVGHRACLSSFEKYSEFQRLASRTQIGLV